MLLSRQIGICQDRGTRRVECRKLKFIKIKDIKFCVLIIFMLKNSFRFSLFHKYRAFACITPQKYHSRVWHVSIVSVKPLRSLII